MPACQIEDYQDTPQARAELIPWLVATEPSPLSAETWGKRLAHWWDQNPFASLRNERGWVLRHESRIVGFMALIPACYAVNGQPVAALIASSWRIDAAHRNASLPMLMKLRRLAADSLIADTTPTPEVQALLQRGGWTGLTDIQRRFVPLGWAAKVLPYRSWPVLPPGHRITRDPAEVQCVAASCMSATSVEKWITPEYLRWFTAALMRRHEFIGVIDSAGCLSSYLFVTPKSARSIPAWMEIDHFTTTGSHEELHALVGALVRQPGLLGSARRILSLSSFAGDSTWDYAPAWLQRQEKVCHYFALPSTLKPLSKRTVLAEGDWGL